MLGLVIMAVFLGAIWVYAVPMLEANSTVSGWMQNKYAMIALTGAFILGAVFLASHVLRIMKLPEKV